MNIANPIYDVVFKYLMEDEEIARALLSAIIGEVQMLPQEIAVELPNSTVGAVRFDFKAEIKLKNNTTKKILIELQKANRFFDIMRFRRYLGENYRTPDLKANETDDKATLPLPIVTIYFLGFVLDRIKSPVLHVFRQYRDALTNKTITKKADFIELLTHDSFVIQIPLLKASVQNILLELLQIFSMDFKTKNRHILNFTGNTENPIVEKMVNRLSRAISDEEIRRKMDFEDEIETVFKREYDKILKELNAERKKAEEERLKAEAADKKAEEERMKAETADKKAAQLQQELDELKKLLKKD